MSAPSAPILVKDAAAYAKMLIVGIGGVTDTRVVHLTHAIDQLVSSLPENATFDLDEAAETDYQAARKAAQDAIASASDPASGDAPPPVTGG